MENIKKKGGIELDNKTKQEFEKRLQRIEKIEKEKRSEEKLKKIRSDLFYLLSLAEGLLTRDKFNQKVGFIEERLNRLEKQISIVKHEMRGL